MDKPLLKSALSKIWALVYRATQKNLDSKQLDELHEAVNTVERDWP